MFDKLDMGNLGSMMGSIQEKVDEMQKIKQEDDEKIFSMQSGGGLVDVEIKGNGEIIDLNIDDSLLTDKESLQILLIGCINDCYKELLKNKEDKVMDSMMSGIGSLLNKQ